MEKGKDVKTNAMRILDAAKISYKVDTYECDEFIDGVHIADLLSKPHEIMYKTLITKGRGGDYFAFVIPVEKELDLKAAARAVGEKSVEMIPVKDINKVTGYIRGGCTAIGMKKQYKTVIDESAILYDEIIVSGGRIGSQITLAPDDFIKAAKAEYAPVVFD